MKDQNEEYKLKLVPFIMNRGVKNTGKTPYGVTMIQAKSMWIESSRGQGINIAVIDSGCDVNHESLKDNIVAVRNFTDEDKKNPNIVIDRLGHGTHVAGIIAANGNNNTIVGVAPWANLYVLKAIDRSGSGKVSWVVNAINYAVEKKVDIISMSLGMEEDDPKMEKAIKNAIRNNNQVILFLNRRGYANFVSCRNCGYVFQCENCDISLTYHKGKNVGRCHYCGYEKEIPKECPDCGSHYVKPFGTGTQKIEEEIKSIFENVKVLRMDKDTTSKKGSIEEILNKFRNKEADILIGTQMLSKGLDFENVTLVGILSADMILNFPDFKSAETTFQLVTQVAGRAGRADKEGKVILQTYDTDHYAIRRSINYDFEGFYEDEIKIREAFGYAPFNNMLSVVISGSNEKIVEQNARSMYSSIIYLLENRGIKDFDFILGPNPCSISKINHNYRWQILFKDDNIEINLLKGIIKYICITKREVVFNKDINISIDINPNSVL